MEEFFEIWVGRSLGFHEKPVIILDPQDFYQPLRFFLEHLAEQKFLKPHQLDYIIWTKNIEEALDACTQRI
jgi:predicted Rossmann-fold nucleotide-binding protein